MTSGEQESTPAALVEHGTQQDQRVMTGTLATLPCIVNQSDVSAPTLLIIGDVVLLKEKLEWFQKVQPEHLSSSKI